MMRLACVFGRHEWRNDNHWRRWCPHCGCGTEPAPQMPVKDAKHG